MGFTTGPVAGLVVLSAVLGAVLGACTREAPADSEGVPMGRFAGTGDYFLPVADSGRLNLRVVYVPAYSRIYLSEGRTWELAATLSIRNVDAEREIVVTGVEYYDSAGRLVETFLDEPHALGPMATTSLVVPQSDERGGEGANFLVRWGATADVPEPVIEAVMAGVSGTLSFSFVAPGKRLEGR